MSVARCLAPRGCGSGSPGRFRASGSGRSSTARRSSSGSPGHVLNDEHGVVVEAEGPETTIGELVFLLEHEAPPLAVVESVAAERIEPDGRERLPDPRRPRATARRTRWSPPTWRRATRALPSSSIRPTGATATRSSTARTAARASRSSRASPTTARSRRWRASGCARSARPSTTTRSTAASTPSRTPAQPAAQAARLVPGTAPGTEGGDGDAIAERRRCWPTARSWRSRGSAATTWPATLRPRRRSLRSGRASIARRSRSR